MKAQVTVVGVFYYDWSERSSTQESERQAPRSFLLVDVIRVAHERSHIAKVLFQRPCQVLHCMSELTLIAATLLPVH